MNHPYDYFVFGSPALSCGAWQSLITLLIYPKIALTGCKKRDRVALLATLAPAASAGVTD